MPEPRELAPITLLFSDVERSSEGWQRHGDPFGDAIRRLHALAREQAKVHRGQYVKHTGDGFLLAFDEPGDAVVCAYDIQRALCSAPEDGPCLSLRVGIHTDMVRIVDGEFTGFGVWRTQRVMDAAPGGQVMLSDATYALVRLAINVQPGFAYQPMGEFRLRGVKGLTSLYRLDAPGLPPMTAPVRAQPEGRSNLPDEERPFVGRARERAELVSRLRARHARLITVTGIGGVGKSRLAREAARDLVEDYPAGVWLIELEALATAEQMAGAISAVLPVDVDVLSLPASSPIPVASEPFLLVLDCFERLVAHAPLVERLLRAAPGAHCLVTSRVVLGLDREFEYPLDPMPSDAQGTTDGEGLPDSVALFEEAASHVVPGFRITASNRKLASELCQALEGIPLSVLLAAARLRHLSLADLLAQVRSRRFGVLRRTSTGTSRHGALQQVVADSIELLPGDLARLLVRLGIFQGGFHLADALAVVGGDDGIDVVDGTSLLREHSLLFTATVGERTRFRLLDTIREYLAGLPHNDDVERDLAACRDRHARHFAAAAERIDDLMRRGRWSEGTADLWHDIGNMGAAVAHAIGTGDDTLVMSFARTLGRFYCEAGLWDDFHHLADAAESAAKRACRQDIAAALLGLRGAVAARQGDRARARDLWHQRVDLSMELGDVAAAADTLLDLADAAREAQDLAAARGLLRRAVRVAGPKADPGLRATAHVIHADMALTEGRTAQALRAAGKAAALLDGASDPGAALYCHARLGRIYSDLGALDAGEDELVAAVRLASQGNRDMSLIGALLDLADLCERKEDVLRAAQACAIAARIHPDLTTKRTHAAARAADRYGEHDDPAVRQYLEAAAGQTWQDLLPAFLDDPPADTRSGAVGVAPNEGSPRWLASS